MKTIKEIKKILAQYKEEIRKECGKAKAATLEKYKGGPGLCLKA